MDRPPVLSEPLVEELRQTVGIQDQNPGGSVTETYAPPPKGIKQLIKRWIRRSIAWYVDPGLHHVQQLAERSLGQSQLVPELAEVAATLRINLELLKGEVRNLEQRLHDLGLAIAPAAGLDAAGPRLAELRERLNAVERRSRQTAPPATGSENVSPQASPPGESNFDYVGFEYRFRGDPEFILQTLKDRYLKLVRNHPPVLDIGCGRGELLDVLKQEGVQAEGVDLDTEMVVEARARGLEVAQADAVGFLRGRDEKSFGSMIAIHVVEHLELDYLVEFLALAVSRLRPGGVLILETPNPTSLIVLGNSYILDPTHVRPLHPSLLTFLCESAGFRNVRLEFHSPAESHRLELIEDSEAPPWARTINDAFGKLNEDLFGSQEYSLIATTPAES